MGIKGVVACSAVHMFPMDVRVYKGPKYLKFTITCRAAMLGGKHRQCTRLYREPSV